MLAFALVASLTIPAFADELWFARADSNESDAVLEVIQTLFDGMRARDTAQLASIHEPDAWYVSVRYEREGPPVIRRQSLSEFLASMAAWGAMAGSATAVTTPSAWCGATEYGGSCPRCIRCGAKGAHPEAARPVTPVRCTEQSADRAWRG